MTNSRERFTHDPCSNESSPVFVTFLHQAKSSPVSVTFLHQAKSSPVSVTFLHQAKSSPVSVTFMHQAKSSPVSVTFLHQAKSSPVSVAFLHQAKSRLMSCVSCVSWATCYSPVPVTVSQQLESSQLLRAARVLSGMIGGCTRAQARADAVYGRPRCCWTRV